MKLLTFSETSRAETKSGVVVRDRILDLQAGFRSIYQAEPPNWFSDAGALLSGGDQALDLARSIVSKAGNLNATDGLYRMDSVTFRPPVPSPSKILCIAANYAEHSKEVGGVASEEPYVFIKLSTCLVGHRCPVPIPRVTKQLDHEIELAVVIGKRGKYIPRARALDYVAGYTVFNDISSRDFRLHKVDRYKVNWFLTKSMDGSAPTGPWMVTKDEVPYPQNLRLIQKVNGEIRQNGSTRDMTFSIPEIIEYASTGVTLMPGDIISTGTPSGVGLATGKFLKAGDLLESEIEQIGTLVNPIVDEPQP